jgi:hypothetical protein
MHCLAAGAVDLSYNLSFFERRHRQTVEMAGKGRGNRYPGNKQIWVWGNANLFSNAVATRVPLLRQYLPDAYRDESFALI